MPPLPVGARVRVKSLSLVLRDPGAPEPLYGTVEAPDEADYYKVRLDREVRQATVVGWADGHNLWGEVPLAGIIELADNLEVLREAAD